MDLYSGLHQLQVVRQPGVEKKARPLLPPLRFVLFCTGPLIGTDAAKNLPKARFAMTDG